MKFIFFILIFISFNSYSQNWGVKVEDGLKSLRIGGRIQGVLSGNSLNDSQDLYLRRLRLNIEFKPFADSLINFDIRNDNSNRDMNGDGEFIIGDAYWRVFTPNSFFNNITLFRAKVDVSYSQTSSSRHNFQPNRTFVSDYASTFIIHNRRATNIQINGNLNDLYYQIAIADGVNEDALRDANNTAALSIIEQRLSYGAKLRYFFIGDAKKNRVQDTFYGEHDTFSLGLGHFRNDKIVYEEETTQNEISRSLTNIELSYAQGPFRLVSEWFEFQGTILDMPNEVIGTSQGYYIQTEYIFSNKVAPFLYYEDFNWLNSQDGHHAIVKGVGVNYYVKNDSLRYGSSLNHHMKNESLQISDSIDLNFYVFMNY